MKLDSKVGIRRIKKTNEELIEKIETILLITIPILVILLVFSYVAIVGWNRADVEIEYLNEKIEEQKMIIEKLKGNSSND